jgi:hypothetical protein
MKTWQLYWKTLTAWVFLALALVSGVQADETSLCAEVRIDFSFQERAQELTLERQAFEATMRAVYFVYLNSNSLDTFRAISS